MANKVISISALNKYIKHLLTNDVHLKNISVTGEISNYTPHHSKHMYFTLKDEQSRIDSVMFATNASKVDFPLKNGDKVVASGYIDVYPPTGKYQMYVTKLELDGIGDLSKKFEILKTKLTAEGLFEQSLKKPIPKYPKKIGVITATSGAAVRDIISTIERRYKLSEVVVFRTIVQGENSKESIINSLNLAAKANLDVVIIGRGGGSIEDLWSFNEESVIRRISEFDTPIISGVGHETDFTLCDFVCDVRAETPTAAAVIATPNVEDVLIKFKNVDEVLKSRFNTILSKLEFEVFKYSSKYLSDKLIKINLENTTSYVHELKRLDDSLKLKLNKSTNDFNILQSKDLSSILKRQLNKHEIKFNNLNQNLNQRIENIVKHKNNIFSQNVAVLEQVSPLKILSRGYSVSYSNGKLVKSVNDVGDNLNIMLSDGEVNIKISSKEVNNK